MSAAPAGFHVNTFQCEQLAIEVLRGVGDAALGEWYERTAKAVHIRRRLAAAEQLLIGEAKDLRGTSEALRRFDRVYKRLPFEARMMARYGLGMVLGESECTR